MGEFKIPARAVSMLIKIKQALLADNDLCNRVCGLGKLAMANYMDDLINNACRIETLYHDYYCTYKITKETFDEINSLMYGYTPDILSDDRLNELKTLVSKWRVQDDNGGAEGWNRRANV